MMNPKRRSVLQMLASTGILSTAAIGTASADRRAGASGDETIVDIAVEAGDFEVLVAALDEADLVETLDGRRQLTVFAPTDQAFGELADTLDVDVEDLLELDDLEDILLYHVTSGRRYADSVVNAPRIEMLNGDTVDADGTVLNDGQAEIDTTDIEASNGVIHAIDGVLLP